MYMRIVHVPLHALRPVASVDLDARKNFWTTFQKLSLANHAFKENQRVRLAENVSRRVELR